MGPFVGVLIVVASAFQIQSRLLSTTEELFSLAKKINQSVTATVVDNRQAWTVDGEENGVVSFRLEPVVLQLPERLGSSGTLYVVLEGRMDAVLPQRRKDDFLCVGFGTKMAYFRDKTNRIEHILGLHYDLDKTLFGHPVFHAQLCSHVSSADHLETSLNLRKTVEDHVSRVLRNARIPTAQMDPLSAYLQLVADHLLGRDSALEDKNAFRQMLDSTRFLKGMATSLPSLSQAPASDCYRSLHWYEQNTP